MKTIRGGGPVASRNQTIPGCQLWDVVVVGAGPAGAMAAFELVEPASVSFSWSGRCSQGGRSVVQR